MHKNIPILTFLLFVFVAPVFAGPTDTICSSGTYCDSAVWFNNTYFVDTVATHDIVDEDGRTIHYVDTIRISHSVHTDIYDTICQNELPYRFISGLIDTTFQTLDAPMSTINFYFFTQSDCDSIVTLNMKVNPIPELPSVTAATRCGPDTVTLQAVVGQNGTTCYWYDSENSSDTIHSGTSLHLDLSQTTVFYVSSVNVETGCASACVADTAIIYSVPSSPSVNDTVRCGTGPMTLNVTVEDPAWTVQWFANDTATEALCTGNQYLTDTLEVSTVPYVYYVQCSDEHCQSSRVMLTVMVDAIPEMYAIIGDTLVCRNEYLEFRYPVVDTENYQYVWFSYFDPDSDSTFGYTIPLWERYIVDSVPHNIIVGMRVQDLQTNCLNDTTIAIHVCEGFSPDRTKVIRKNNSNILICDNSDFPDNVHYRWGYTDKFTFDENAYDWDYSYYHFSDDIDTIQFRYWVETYVINGDVTCRNRTYYQDDIETGLDQLEQLDVLAFMRGNQLMIQVGNPSEQHTVAVLYDLSGRTIAQWDFGTASVIREQISFGYPNGIYLLTVQVGNRRHTTKILSQQ